MMIKLKLNEVLIERALLDISILSSKSEVLINKNFSHVETINKKNGSSVMRFKEDVEIAFYKESIIYIIIEFDHDGYSELFKDQLSYPQVIEVLTSKNIEWHVNAQKSFGNQICIQLANGSSVFFDRNTQKISLIELKNISNI